MMEMVMFCGKANYTSATLHELPKFKHAFTPINWI